MAPKLYSKPRVYNKRSKMTRRKDAVTNGLGNPVLNDITDEMLKMATIAVVKVAAEDTYSAVKRRSVSNDDLDCTLKRMGKEGVYWGTIAGVYMTTEYGLERVRGRRDWKTTMIAGAVTGAVMSAVNKNNKDKILADAVVGGAVASAAEFLRNYFTGSLRKL